MKRASSSVNARPDEAGQTMVEFALVATALCLLIFGLTNMGLVVSRYSDVSFASREAVRYAIVHSPTSANPATTAQIQQIAINYAPFLSTSNIAVTWPADAQLPSQSDAQVKISYDYALQIPFMSAMIVHLASTSQMLVSQ